MLEIWSDFSLVPVLVPLLSTDDYLLLWKQLLCSAKNSDVLFCSTKRLVYLLSAIDYYLHLHVTVFPSRKKEVIFMEFPVCSVATEGNAVVSLIEEAAQF